MVAESRLIGVVACKVFPHVQVFGGDFSRFLEKTITTESAQSTFDDQIERWLIIFDDTEPPALEVYCEAHRHLANSSFQRIFLATQDGQLLGVSS